MNFKDKVIYQIYPKSFKDSNNDGLGDVKGIIEKLDYLQYLGIDYIWVSPIFLSPQNDNGYDITDYYAIDPLYGSMEEVEELILESKKRGIGILFDMVFNHTSTSHIWFQKALKGDKKYKDYYYFKKGKDGIPPTNWDSKFGGNAWQYVPALDEYYLSLYDATQADLNWENVTVRDELIKVINFWIKKGIKGFRFDVINNINKHTFKDDYEGVGKRFYTDGPKMREYLQELNRRSFGQYQDIITVGEMSATTIKNCVEYTKPDHHELDMAFNFHHLKVDYEKGQKWTDMPFDFIELKRLFNTWQTQMQRLGGWNALFWNCHDQPRSVSRFGNDTKYHKESAKMLASALHMQRGTPYIYQGEEIGMTNAHFTNINQYKDVESINAYTILKGQGIKEEKVYKILQDKSRDNSRTPMQWNASNNAGFSDVKPWIEAISNYKEINVEESLKDPTSILEYYRSLIMLRKKYDVVSNGEYIPYVDTHPQVYAYKRITQKEEVLIINNFYDKNTVLELEDTEYYEVLLSNYPSTLLQKEMKLKPYESIILYRKKLEKE